MRYEIKIPNPCNEKWDEMTTTEKGAFCSNCKKEVFDFTNTSNYQLAKFLDTNSRLCGKFKPEQLNTEISPLETNKYSKTRILLGITSLLSLSTPIFSQNKLPEIVKTEQSNSINNDTINNKKTTDSIQLKGKVFDGSGPLPGASIFIKNQSYMVESDFDGNFSINIKKKDIKKNLILVISFVGLNKQEVKINSNTKFIKVKMEESNHIVGEIVIIKKQNIFRRIGNLFRNKKNCH